MGATKNVYSDVEIATIKKRFLDELWQYKVIGGKYKSKASYVSGKVVCTNSGYNKFIHNQWAIRDYKLRHVTLNDYLSECILITQYTMQVFNPREKSYDWMQLFADEGTSEKKILFNYLITAVKSDLHKYSNWWMDRKTISSSETTNGKKVFSYHHVTMNQTSIDVLIQGDQEDTVLQTLSDNASIFTNYVDDGFASWQPNRKNHFLQWFHDNKREVIPELWLKRFEIMAKSELTDSYKDAERKAETGLNKDAFSGTKRNIAKFALEAYEKEFGDGLTMLEASRREGIQLLGEFIQLLKAEVDDDLHRVQITNWIVKNMEKSRMLTDLIYDKLDSKHIKNIVKGFMKQTLPNETVYEVTRIIEKKIEQLESFDAKVVKFYKKDIEKKPVLKLIVNENYVEPPAKEKKQKEKHRYYNLSTTGATVELIHNK